MSNIGDPFVLSTYSQPKISSKSGSSGLPNVFASFRHASTSSSEGYVTVAAQGDGVHVLDLSTLHPTISYTLGPQSRFSCPPATRISQTGTSRLCTTYAVIESGSDVNSEARGRTVWRWKEDPSGNVTSAEAQKRRISAVIPHKISSVYLPDELPNYVVLVGPGGEITTTDTSLVVKNTYTPEAPERLLRSSNFPRKLCSFLSSRVASAPGVVVVLISQKTDTVHVTALAVAENGAITPIAKSVVPLQTSLSILDVTCGSTGFVTILTSSGLWHAFDLRLLDDSTLVISQVSEPVPLSAMSFTPSQAALNPQSALIQREVALASVGSSHVLLAGFTTGSSSELVILLWDLRYSVVLASHHHSIPSSLGRTKKNPAELTITADISDSSQISLVLSPQALSPLANGSSDKHPPSGDSNARSTIFVVPLTVPPKSTIANALGRAPASAKWIAQPLVTASGASSGLDSSRITLLQTMRTAMEQKKASSADEGFFSWLKQEETKLPKAPEGTPQNDVELGHKFVQGVLEIVLAQPKGVTENIPYSPKVLRHFLKRRVVSSSMVQGGLLPALRLRNDWESVILTIKTVIDIPEADLVSFLHDVIIRQPPQDEEDTMQVDSSSDPSAPRLSDILALCVTYPTSAPALRLAFHRHLRDAGHLTSILGELLEWIESWCGQEATFLPEQTTIGQDGVLVPVLQGNRSDIPPLDKVLNFVQVILDSSFVTFLSHSPSHELLRRIMTCLQPELVLNDEMGQLRGPLEPFVKAQAKAVSEATNGPPKIDPKVDWRQRKKALHEQAAMSIGVYQLEELVL